MVHEEHEVENIHQCLNLDLDYIVGLEDLLDELAVCIRQCLNLDLDYIVGLEDLLDELAVCTHQCLNLNRRLDCNVVHEESIHQLMILDLLAEKDELVECIHQRLNLSLRPLGYSLVHEENLKSLRQLKVKMVCLD